MTRYETLVEAENIASKADEVSRRLCVGDPDSYIFRVNAKVAQKVYLRAVRATDAERARIEAEHNGFLQN